MHAKLIDLESTTEEGQSAEGSPTAMTTTMANREQRPRTATHAFDQQCVCAVLQCLWEMEMSSFEKRAELVPTFADENARTELINKLNE
jgi:hypothetical protein